MSEQFNGTVDIRDSANNTIISLDGDHGNLTVWQKIDVRRQILRFTAELARLHIGTKGNEGRILIKDDNGRRALNFDSQSATLYIGAVGNNGEIIVQDENGSERVRLDGQTGDIRLRGADCAEEFDIVEERAVDPGTVLVIDDDGKLAPCEQSYDKKVAGVVSGAHGFTPGIILDRNDTLNKRLPIALSGKVYCKVDAQFGSVGVGDLLTTSPTMGHAMKANDSLHALGTVIGKALQALNDGQGFIPILVSLQ